MDVLVFRQTTFHLYQKVFEPLLELHGLSQMEMDILLFLANNPQYDTATEITALRAFSKSQVSMTVEQLVRKGYLSRHQDSANRRKIHLKILPAAEPLVQSGRECQEVFRKCLLKGLSQEDQQKLKELLDAIIQNTKDAYIQRTREGEHAL